MIRFKIKPQFTRTFDNDLRDATVVTVYQNQETNRKLKTKFEKELKPGTRVISHVFTFDGWEPIKVDEESQICLYYFI